MATLMHLCRKDYSYAKHALWGAWVVFLVAELMPSLISGAFRIAEAAIPNPLAVAIPNITDPLLAADCLLVFAAVMNILRADSYSGGHAFIGTRPVSKAGLWFSKILSIAAFVLVPWVVAKAIVIGILAAKVHPSVSDWALLVCEKVLSLATIVAVALVVGTNTRHFASRVLLTIALGTGVIWLADSLLNRSRTLDFITEARHLKASQWIVAQTLIMLSGLALSWLWITRRSPVMSIAAGGFLATLVFLGSKHWNINFIERLAAPQTTVKPRISWVGDPRVSESSRGSIPVTKVNRGLRMDGIPEGWIAFPAGVKSQARFADGSILNGDAANSLTVGVATRTLLPSLSNGPLTKPAPSLDGFAFFERESGIVRTRTGMPCRLEGEAHVELHEPIFLANLPARSEQSFTFGRFRFQTHVRWTARNMLRVEILATGVSLSSISDLGGWPDSIELFIVNARSGFRTEIGKIRFFGFSQHGMSFMSGGCYETEPLSLERQEKMNFLKDARLYLIGRRYRGTVRVPFEIPDLNLNTGQ